jgi:hypothetical protein
VELSKKAMACTKISSNKGIITKEFLKQTVLIRQITSCMEVNTVMEESVRVYVEQEKIIREYICAPTVLEKEMDDLIN